MPLRDDIIDGRILPAVRRAVERSGELAKDEIERLQSTPVGRGANGVVIRSRPGEPPRAETRKLVASHTLVVDFGYDRAVARVSSTDPKQKYLERGTQKMRPRPTYSVVRRAIRPVATRLVREAMGDAGR